MIRTLPILLLRGGGRGLHWHHHHHHHHHHPSGVAALSTPSRGEGEGEGEGEGGASERVVGVCKAIAGIGWGPSVERSLLPFVPELTPRDVAQVLRLQTDKRQAFRFFIWAARQDGRFMDNDVCDLLSNLWGHSRQVTDFISILRSMERISCEMTESMFTVLMKGYGLAGMAKSAHEVYQQMRWYCCRPNLVNFNCLLDVLLKGGDHLALVQSVHLQMLDLGFAPDAYTYSILISGFCRRGNYPLANRWLYKMIERGHIPGVLHYHHLLAGFLRQGSFPDAYRVFSKLNKLGGGSLLDSVTKCVMISCMCEAGYVSSACKLLMDLMKGGGNCLFDLIGNKVIHYLNMGGDVVMVERIHSAWSRRRRCKPDPILYDALIDAFAMAGKFSDAFKIWGDMRHQSYIPDMAISAKLVGGLLRLGLLDEALTISFYIKEQYGSSVKVFNLLIPAFCKAGHLNVAFQLETEMLEKGFGPQYIIFNSLIDALCVQGMADEAYAKMGEMCAKRCYPDIVIYNMVIKGYCREERMGNALALLEEMEREGCYPDSYTLNTLVNSFCRASRIEEAKKLARKMLTDGGCVADLVTFNTFLNAFLRCGDRPAAAQCLKEIKERGWTPDLITYTTILCALVKEGNSNAARWLMEDLLDGGFQPDKVAYMAILQALCRTGEVLEAYRVLGEAIELNRVHVVDAHSILASCLSRAGRYHAARQVPLDLVTKGGLLDILSSYTHQQ